MIAAYTAKGDSFAAEKPRRWSNTQTRDVDPVSDALDLAPEGKRFLALRPPQDASPSGPKGSVHVTFLLNFFNEVERRIPLGK
jgi:hypothetical protein